MQIDNIKNERRGITIRSTDIKMKRRIYYEKIYAT